MSERTMLRRMGYFLTFKKSQIYLAFCLQSRTFAVVKVIRRQISAFFLLAVFLPMLALSSLHIHEAPQAIDTECSDCVHHNCHGHLTAIATWAHECVLCQFLTLPMFVAVILAVTVYINVCKKFRAQTLCICHRACCGTIVTRGPPTF